MICVNQEQARASNPFDSVWVSASAGTGKTKVLTDRVLRLLLQVSAPEKILCLTFTKAAASEMANRINKVLKNWATCSEDILKQEIESLIQEPIEVALISKARELFSKTLDAAGGMKIMTIHSFCQSLLKRFPLEAAVPPHFDVLDDLSAITVKEQILNEALINPHYQKFLQDLSALISTNSLLDLLERILNESPRLMRLLVKYPGGIESLIFNIKKYFNIHDYHSEKQIINEYFNEEEWPIKKQYYLTQNETVRVAKKEDKMAWLAWETNERLKKFRIIQATQTLLNIAFQVIRKYENIKAQKALLDYTDLIEKTNTLLLKSTMASWVLYKLDGGIDHILVDEAQDTNRSQWEIIKALAEEFFSGEGARENLRTLFVVGDKKQSIFSFQGADPMAFEEMRDYFEKRIIASENSFYNIPLNYSFRSTEPVLRLVNNLLENEHAKDGVLFGQETAYHLANRSDDAGLVEIWPVEENQPTDTPNPWKPPVERVENESAMKRLIDKMADKIKLLVGGEELPSQNRKIRPGDILILLQKRGTMMSEIVRALRKRDIPVAGVDRLLLSEHLAIQDLMALTEFVLQPLNDLNLANLVKSPILGLTEADLYTVCIDRGSQSIWARLQQLYPQQAKNLRALLNLADQTPPFEFYSTVLGSLGYRKKFIARFGNEVNDALDELLNLALIFEKNNTPNLQKFLQWFSAHPVEIKRDLDSSEMDAVRLMTVHGSKGLQGNIVFLPDTRSTRTKPSTSGDFIWVTDDIPLWIPNSHMRPICLTDWFKRKELLEQQEKRRLLYVALTRARDRLYICGYGKGGANNWYDLIQSALPESVQRDSSGIIHWNSLQKKKVQTHAPSSLAFDFQTVPPWAVRLPPQEMPESQPISPSKLGKEEDIVPENSVLDTHQALALKRGSFLHKLLQFLPSLPEEKRMEYAQKLCPPDIDLPDSLFQIFHEPHLKELFGDNSLAEVPVVGQINGQMISGQIDRLVILPKEVKIIDFKTNIWVPKQVPEIYKNQLRAYKDLLKEIFPDKIITTYILWLQTLTFEEIQ